MIVWFNRHVEYVRDETVRANANGCLLKVKLIDAGRVQTAFIQYFQKPDQLDFGVSFSFFLFAFRNTFIFA